MLEIRAPQHFHLPEHLTSQLDTELQDPRDLEFVTDRVLIDLHDCTAISLESALWCVVYASLLHSRAIGCQVQIPASPAVLSSLTASGFFSLLSDRGIELLGNHDLAEARMESVVLPFSAFDSPIQSERVGYEIQDSLQQKRSLAANIPSIVTEIFFELINNALEHSQSPVGGFASVQMDSDGRVLCAVADGGIGIKESLRHNPDVQPLYEDRQAIALALEEGVTGTTSRTRGIGLNWVKNASRLTVYSGGGIIGDAEDVSTRGIVFPGTLAVSASGGG